MPTIRLSTYAPPVCLSTPPRYIEYFSDDRVLSFRRLINNQMSHRQGKVVLRQTPGLGFDFDQNAVAKYGKWTSVP